MSTHQPTLRILCPSAPPTTPQLNLMPFHIDHDGPAPMSTYFIVQPDPTSVDVPNGTSEASATAPAPKTSLKERFVSTFRGRTLRGLRVPVPPAYTGVLFRSTTPAIPRPSPKKRGAKGTPGRATRNSRKMAPVDEDEDMDFGLSLKEEDISTKDLKVEGVFDSFVLWTPDVEVDAGDDPYMKGLDEWLTLSALVNRVDDGA